VQQIIREVGRAYEDQAGASLNAAQQRGIDGLIEAGATVADISDEVRAGWAESLASFANQQAKEADGRGQPGSEVMQTFIDAVGLEL